MNYRDAIVSVSFYRGAEAFFSVKATAETVSEVSIKFPETGDLEYISDLYLSVRGFFSFICNRQNIGLRNAMLIGRYPTKTLKEGKVVDKLGHTRQKLFGTMMI